MKNHIIILLLFIGFSVQAQFYDDMESYTDGEPISGGHWTDWGCGGGVGCSLISSSVQAYDGSLSGLIPDDGTTDAVLDLGGKIFGNWCFSFWMYVPSNKEAFWGIMDCVPICASDWSIHLFFNQNNTNPGVGLIDNSALGPINFNFPHDVWFRIIMTFDISSGISLATWEFYIAGEEVIPNGTPFTNQAGTIPTTLGGINFFSISSLNSYYLDLFDFYSPIESCFYILENEDYKSDGFSVYPNPVSDALYLQAEQEMTSISIRNVLGQEVYSSNMEALNYRVDVSNFSTGTYFVSVTVGKETVTKRFIKN